MTGSNPGWPQGFTPSAAQWAAAFSAKQDDIATLDAATLAALVAQMLTPAALLAAFATFSPAQIAALQAIIGTSASSGSLDLSPINPLTAAALN